MPDAAVPVTLAGQVYHIRYTYPDFKAMEKALGIGYVHFLRDEIFKSLTALEVFLWAGLKKEVPENGRWVHVFPQTPEGQEQAGLLLWDHLRQSGELIPVTTAVFDSFVTTGPWKRAAPKPDIKKPASKKEKIPPKNLKT